jgi:hypothetical protein
MLGMLSPSYRGALVTSGLFLYVFMGLVAGYYSGRLYKTLRGVFWKQAALATAIFYPFVVFGVCFLLNFFIWGKKSSGAVPFSTMLALLTMIFGISLPLVFLGYYFGYRKQVNNARNNSTYSNIKDFCFKYSSSIFFKAVFATSTNQPNTETSARSNMVHESIREYSDGWHFAIRSLFY